MANASLLGSVTWNTTAGTKTVTATPAVGDQIFLVTAHSGFTTTTTAPTDNNPDGNGTYTVVASCLKNSSADLIQIWRRNSLIGNASSTTFTHAPASTTGGGVGVIKVAGIPTAGASVVIQSGTQPNASSGTTPTVTLGRAASASSVMLAAVFSTTNGASATERSGYTEQFDAGYNTPASGLEIITRASGETGSSIAWGSTVPSAYGAVVVEINAPAVGAAAGTGSASGVGSSIAVATGSASGTGAASTIAPPTATLTMTQLASAKRVYQRSTTSGGGQSKGQGTIPVSFSAVTVAGTVNARCRASDGTTIIQPEWQGATIASTGAQTVNITGVDARLGWFYLDIKDSSGTWQNGTTLVGMGRVIGLSGQSLAVRMVKVQDTSQTSVTLASLSLTPDANSSVFHSYADNTSLSSPTWATPADSSNYDSAGCVEYLNREIAAVGVNCGLIGHSAGGTSITSFIGAGAEVSALHTNLDAAAGWEAYIHFQGHTDAQNGMSQATFQSNLDTLFADLASHNAILGSSFEKYIMTIPNIGNDSWGTAAQRNEIRAAGRAWCAANSAVSVEAMDIALNSDGVSGTHQTQAGSITLARHFYRASRPSLGLSHNDNGPTFTASRSGATITLTPTYTDGGTSLSLVGTPSRRVGVSTKGGYARMPITSLSLVSGNISIVLATTPAANDALEISFDHDNTTNVSTGNDGSADMILDNGTDGESGMTAGRPIDPTFKTPISVAAPTPSLGPTLTAGGTALYGTGATGFGSCLDGSAGFYAFGATSGLGDDGIPYSNVLTVECRFKLSALPGSTAVIFSGSWVWVGVDTAGKLTGTGFSGATHNFADGAWHHVRFVGTEDAVKVYVDGTLEASGGATNVFSLSTGTFAIGALHNSGAFPFPGLIDEFASFTTALNSGNFTPPSSPYTGNEAGLYSLYHLDSSLAPATPTTSSVGSASGIGAASGVGASLFSGSGSSSGTGSATSVGRATTTAAGAAAGTSTANAVSTGIGSSAGVGAASGVGAPLATGVGSSNGTGAASGVGQSQALGVGAASGLGAATGVGKSNAAGAGASAGTGTASGVGASLSNGVGSASGTGAAAGTSTSSGTATGTGSATGTGAAAAIGSSQARTAGSGVGNGAATAAGASQASGSGAAAGSGACSATGASTARGAGASTAAGSASASANSIVVAAGSSANTGTAAASGTGAVEAAGSASGTSAAAATGGAYLTGVGLSAGFGVAVGDGQSIAEAVGLSDGTGAADGRGRIANPPPVPANRTSSADPLAATEAGARLLTTFASKRAA